MCYPETLFVLLSVFVISLHDIKKAHIISVDISLQRPFNKTYSLPNNIWLHRAIKHWRGLEKNGLTINLCCACVYKANTKGNWWSPDQGFLGCLKWKSLFINLTNTYPYGMCLHMHRQPVKFPTLIAQPMLSVIIHSVIPISSTWSVRQKRKGGGD